MSDSKLTAADLAKLAEGATKGPWSAADYPDPDISDPEGWTVCHQVCSGAGDRGDTGEANAALIVYLVNHVPEIVALLGENERLREVARAALVIRDRLAERNDVETAEYTLHSDDYDAFLAALAALGKEENRDEA